MLDNELKIFEVLSNIDINALITATAGLVGVLVGAFISYFFNKRINEENKKSRFAIQRKNLIFSKLYKELVYVRESLSSLPKDAFYFRLSTNIIDTNETRGYYQDTFYFNKGQFPLARYGLWSDMKKDIRHTQIPQAIKNEFETLDNLIIEYFTALKKFDLKSSEIEKEKGKKMIEIYQSDSPSHKNSIFNMNLEGLYYKNAKISDIIDETVKQHRLSDSVKEEMYSVVEQVIALDSLKETSAAFDKMIAQVDKTFDKLDELIQYIVNKYEYGEVI